MWNRIIVKSQARSDEIDGEKKKDESAKKLNRMLEKNLKIKS